MTFKTSKAADVSLICSELRIQHKSNSILLDQDSYVDDVQPIPISATQENLMIWTKRKHSTP